MGILLRTGAVIVAAGLSSRMEQFKPLLPFRGSTIIEIIVRNLQAISVEPIVVVTGKNADLLEETLASYPVLLVHNPDYEHTDMFHSVKMGLSQCLQAAEYCFFQPVDVPLVSLSSYKKIDEQMSLLQADALIPTHLEKWGHPVLFDCRALPSVLSYQGPKGLRGAMENTLNYQLLELPDPGVLLDIDSPKDYQLLLSLEDGSTNRCAER